MIRISVIGSGEEISKEAEKAAEKIGADIAKNNCVLICGGREGVMEAACRGAKSNGGITVGILPSLEKEEANKYIDIAINTGFGHARNALVAASGDCVIALEGSIGTLSEIAMALNYRKTVVIVAGTKLAKIFKEHRFQKFGEEIKVNFSGAENAVGLALELIGKN